MKHKLKIEQHYLDALLDGSKTFEIRLKDRGYQKGDTLEFHDPFCIPSLVADCRNYHFKVTYVHSGLGLAPNYVVMSVVRQEVGE